MNSAQEKWIRRKEIAFLCGLSYSTIRRNEIRIGLATIAVRVSPRLILFPRDRAIERLREARLL